MMSYSYSVSETATFTVTHAKYMASKVVTDLKRIQRLYNGVPSDSSIGNYEAELVALLKHGYLGTVTYGFRRGGNWTEPTLRYSARDLAGNAGDDNDPGKIKPNADIGGASFYSYLTYSSAWDNLSSSEKAAFKGQLPFQRGDAPEPGVNGYFNSDRTYAAGGMALDRTSVRSPK